MSEKLDLEPLAKSLLDNKFVGVLLLSNGKIEIANEKAQILFGLNQEKLAKTEFIDLVEFDKDDNSIQKLLEFGQDITVRGTIKHESGSKHPVNIAFNQTSKEYLALFIQPTYDQESFIFLKRQFFKKVTHELRSPLSSIVGALALLKSGKLSKVDNILTIAERNSKRLTLMINSILDIEVFEGGSLILQKTVNDLNDVLNTGLDLVQEYANESNVDLEYSGKSIEIVSDHERLPQAIAQILSFLIANNPQISKITLQTSDSDGWADIKLSYVEATENGIENNELENKADDRTILLPSLTLKMAQKVIELHKGTMTGLDDHITEIWIRLPIRNS